MSKVIPNGFQSRARGGRRRRLDRSLSRATTCILGLKFNSSKLCHHSYRRITSPSRRTRSITWDVRRSVTSTCVDKHPNPSFFPQFPTYLRCCCDLTMCIDRLSSVALTEYINNEQQRHRNTVFFWGKLHWWWSKISSTLLICRQKEEESFQILLLPWKRWKHMSNHNKNIISNIYSHSTVPS